MIGLVAIGLAVATAGQLTLRAGQALPAPEVISVGAAGVVVGENAHPEFVIGWDRVLNLEGGGGADDAGFLATGEALWRARTRLERGDAPGAEPIFERLMPELAGRGGPMPAVAAEGLLRCRLRRGAQVAAVGPWLGWLRAERGGASAGVAPFALDWAVWAGLDPIMDAATGLAPALPPIWLDWPPVRVYATGGGAARDAEGGPPDKASALAGLYLHAARFEAGVEEPMPVVTGATDPGVALVLDIVLARAGGEADRAGARERLAQRLGGARDSRDSRDSRDPRDSWTEAWCRAGIGRSLVREADGETRRLGVVELLHLPARFSHLHPYLAGVCLAEASVTLGELGDAAGAGALRKELFENYPDHPVLAWEKIRLPGAGPALRPGGSAARGAPAVIPLNDMECAKP